MAQDTIVIFSFSGGSTKGYGENRFMQKFLQQWGVSQSVFRQHVDVFAGVSIGALLSCGYSYGKTPDELEPFFLEKAKRIFTIRTAAEYAAGSHNAGTDSNRPNILQKIGFIGTNDTFYGSPYPDSNFGDNILQQELVNIFGTDTLSNLYNYVVIPAVQRDLARPVYFSNFDDPAYFIGQTDSIVDVCRATSAANPYLPYYSYGGHQYKDGAFLVNNAVRRAVDLGITIKPKATKIVVIMVGAGVGKGGFDGSDPLDDSQFAVSRLFSDLTSVMANVEENERENLLYEFERLNYFANRSLYFYSFQPKFPMDFPNEIDNSTPEWFAQLADIIDTHYYSESDKISSIISRLPSL
jgi:predicted acylesterase/phospholipase RssA